MLNEQKEGNAATLLALGIILNIPRYPQYTTARELTEKMRESFNRDKRTIERQLKNICERFDFVECDTSSKPFLYSIKRHASLMSLSGLTAEQSLLLQLARQHISRLLPARLVNESLRDFFDESFANVAGTVASKAKVKRWMSKIISISSTQPMLPPDISDEVLYNVSQALYEDKMLDIEYQNIKSQTSLHRISPLGLVQQGERMYLVCYYEMQKEQTDSNIRTLAVHRIKSANILDFNATKIDFNLEQYAMEGRIYGGKGKLIRLRFETKKSDNIFIYLSETPLSKDQTIERKEDRDIYTATVYDSFRLMRWLYGFGPDLLSFSKEEVL